MSRSTKPKKKVVRDYLRRAQKRLCVAPKDIYPTKAGKPIPFGLRQIQIYMNKYRIPGKIASRTESSLGSFSDELRNGFGNTTNSKSNVREKEGQTMRGLCPRDILPNGRAVSDI